jgi:hypothetical protein
MTSVIIILPILVIVTLVLWSLLRKPKKEITVDPIEVPMPITASGAVRSAFGSALFTAVVTLTDVNNNTVFTTQPTDGFGYWHIDIPKGTYTITAALHGYTFTDKVVNIDKTMGDIDIIAKEILPNE